MHKHVYTETNKHAHTHTHTYPFKQMQINSLPHPHTLLQTHSSRFFIYSHACRHMHTHKDAHTNILSSAHVQPLFASCVACNYPYSVFILEADYEILPSGSD